MTICVICVTLSSFTTKQKKKNIDRSPKVACLTSSHLPDCHLPGRDSHRHLSWQRQVSLELLLQYSSMLDYSHSAALQLHSMVWCTVVCHGPYHRGRLADRGMGSGGVEEWRSEGVEEWKSGGVEEWRSEGVEE